MARPLAQALVTLLIAVSLPVPAVAQDEPGVPAGERWQDLPPEALETAREHFREGLAHYAEGRWADAARAFEESYRITGHPDVLYNLGQAHDRDEQHELAIEAYRGYLEGRADAPDRERVERRIHELEQLLEAAALRDAQAATRAAQPTPASEPTSPSEPPPPESEGSVLPWIVIAAGGALAAGAAVTGVLALSTHSELDEDCGGGPCPADRQDDVDRGESLALASTVLTIGAALVLAAGVVLLVWESPDEDPTVAALELGAGPSLAGISARARFF